MIKVKCTICNTQNELQPQDYEKVIYNDKEIINIFTKCIECRASHFNAPTNESKLFTLQEMYLKNKDSDILGKMYLIIYDIANNIIFKKLLNSGKFQQEDLEDKVSETAGKLITYYLKKPGFKIEDSFTSYITQIALYPLYNKKTKLKDQNEMSLEEILFNVNKQNRNEYSSDNLALNFSLAGSDTVEIEDNKKDWIDEHQINEQANKITGKSKKSVDDKTENFSWNSNKKYSFDDYIIDQANIDFYIQDIMKAIEGILNAVLQKFGMKEMLIQAIFFYHYFGNKDKKFFNRLSDIFGDGSSSKFKTIIDYFHPSFKRFEENNMKLRNALYSDFIKE
jgi:hypothetical protein